MPRTIPLLTLGAKTCRKIQTAAWSENVESITKVCSGKERGVLQAQSIFMCVLRGMLFH